MAGENGGTGQSANSGIDILICTDGITFQLAAQNIVKPRPGQYHVRTPGLHPTDDFIVYYAESADPDGTNNHIRIMEWSP